MSKLSRKDLDVFQNCLRQLYAHHDLGTLARTALQFASKLVPNDLSGYNEVDPSRRRLFCIYEPSSFQEEYTRLAPLWERNMHQHPVLSYFLENAGCGPHKISDFLSDSEFRELDLYKEHFRLISCNYQIAVRMPSPEPLSVAIAMNREKHDFSERDREALTLLQPHLRQAYENAALITSLSTSLDSSYEALDHMDRGIVVIDTEGLIKSASPSAMRFSMDYFVAEKNAGLTHKLPDTLQRWAIQQIAAMQQDEDKPTCPRPLIKQHENGRLVVRAIAECNPNRYLLVMHQAKKLESADTLQGLGLTKREAEVLYWVIEGKSNAEVGQALGIRDRTIHKHMENIFRKLKVPNRATAISKALEWLRL